MASRRKAAAVLVVSLLGIVGVSAFAFVSVSAGCRTSAADTFCNQAKVVKFGDVTEYLLPNPSRDPNGITVAPDGSVWFGIQALAGVGHLFQNGTEREYAWPGYPDVGQLDSEYVKSETWNIQLWNGRVWAADDNGYLVNGLDPANDSTIELNVTAVPHPSSSAPALSPYILTATPYGSMWFTALPYLTGDELPVIGRVSADLNVTLYAVGGLGHQEPIQIQFYNSTLAYVVALDPVNPYDSGLYSFNPTTPGSTIMMTHVGGNFTLIYPDSLTITGNTIWITQHATSAVVSYDLKTGVWTTYPTSNVGYIYATYPYSITSQGGMVWFNEHYANEIALLNPSTGALTEYSEADPPVSSGTGIQQDLTVAAGSAGLWFTSWDGNYIGFVNGKTAPSFSVSLLDGNETTLAPGGSTTVEYELTGSWTGSLQVLTSDSENYNSTPSLISIRPDATSVPPGSGPQSLSVSISAQESIPPGRYTVDVTLSDGLVRQTAFLVVNLT